MPLIRTQKTHIREAYTISEFGTDLRHRHGIAA